MKSIKKIIVEIIVSNKKLIAIGLFIMIIMAILQALIPFAMKEMMSEIEKQASLQVFFVSIGLYAIMWFVYNLINVRWYYYIDVLGEKVLWQLRKQIYHILWKCEYNEYTKWEKEHVKNILFSDAINIYGNIIFYLMNILTDSFMILVFLLVSFFIDISTTFLLLIGILFGLIFSALIKPIMAKHSIQVNKALKEDNAINNECIDAMELIRCNGLQTYYADKVKASIHNFVMVAIKSDIITVFLENIINHYHQILTMIVTGYLVLNAKTTNVGNLVYYIFVTNLVIEKSKAIESNIYRFMKNMASFTNVENILKLDKLDLKSKKELSNIHEIQFEKVGLSYSANTPIMEDICFTLKKGDAVLLKGDNGSGKSSVLKMIAGLIPPTRGNILYNGNCHNEIDKELLYKEICYLNQEELLLNEEPITYLSQISHKQINKDDFEKYCDIVQLDKEFDRITENGKKLSGGEKKKFLLMKLLARLDSSSVILLDEVEAGLDKQSQSVLSQLERKILQNKQKYIIIKISHTNTKNEEDYNKVISLG